MSTFVQQRFAVFGVSLVHNGVVPSDHPDDGIVHS